MSWVWMWIRRTGIGVFPLLVSIQLFALFLRTSWWNEWQWMASRWSGNTLLLSPVAAAVTVTVILRNYPPSVQRLCAPTGRHLRPILHITGAMLVQALGAQLVGLVVGASLCVVAGADTRGLVWLQFLTGPLALTASVTLGSLLAILVPTAWTVPGAGLGIFLAHRPFAYYPYPEPFTIEGATASTGGELRPMPWHLASTAGVNVLLIAALLIVLSHFSTLRSQRTYWPLLIVVGLLVGVGFIYAPWVMTDDWSTYESIP